jgi:hypothetical protein
MSGREIAPVRKGSVAAENLISISIPVREIAAEMGLCALCGMSGAA